ncbi:MAG: helix-turn-helix domain-containing protein [Firmicutes bacterium]|nr:helix-turn-helix domain-containing protein [Bacillota bacterium]
MTEIGQELRQARERLGLTVETITERTMIPKKYLLALEEENYKVFPGEVYMKGALRKYASELGLDVQAIMDLYNRSTQNGLEETAPAPRTARKRKRKKTAIGRNLLVALLILLLAGCVYLIVQNLSERIPQSSPPPATNDKPEPQDNEPPAPPPEDLPQEPAQEEVSVERDTTSAEIRYLVRNAETLEAEMTFSGTCWISVHEDGKETYSGTLQRGQTRTAFAGQELRIRLGNPQVFSLTVCGKQVELPDTTRPYTMYIVKQ